MSRHQLPREPRRWFPSAVLLAGLSLTVFATFYVGRSLELRSRAQFDAARQYMRSAVQARLETHIALLRGLAGYFAAESEVRQPGFKAYVDRLRLATIYPGLQGLGFSIRLAPSQTNELVLAMRNQGKTDFHIWPESTRQEYYPIIFLEPQNIRNRVALGYDMFTDAVRREAMERACDTGMRAASGHVTLVQEIEGNQQAGFLIYAPVYQGGTIPGTVAERRARLKGFVFSPFRIGDMLTSIFDPEFSNQVQVQVFDGEGKRPENLLFSSSPRSHRSHWLSATHESASTLDVAGRTWTVHLREEAPFEGTFWLVPTLLVGGTLLSFILYYLTRAEAQARQRAEHSATQLQRSEQALRESETRLRLILENAVDFAILSLDSAGRVISWNSGSERVFGFTEVEMLGQSGGMIFTKEDSERGIPEEELRRALQDGLARDDRWHQRKDGRRIFVSGVVRPMSDASGRNLGFIKIARDVTDRLEAEERLRHEKEFSDTIINSLPGVLYLIDRTGRMLRWNENLESVTGFSTEEISRHTLLDFFALPERTRVEATLRAVLDSGQGSVEASLVAKDGRLLPHLLSGRRIVLGGQVLVMGMGVDISERLRTEQELRAAEEQLRRYTAELEHRVAERTSHLRQSLQSLEGLLYHVAHDLRAPLRAMASFTKILLEDYAGRFDAHGLDYARRILNSAKFMDKLVQDLLAYGRLAHMQVHLHTIRLQSQVDAVIEQFSDEIKAKQAQVEVQRPLPDVKANTAMLNQVLLNLVDNALKFVPREVPPRVRIRAETDGRVRLWIEDNGIGIKPEYAERIFRVFERLHAASDFPGTGIGLAIVQKGMERMGGRVGVESQPGAGSRFWIELPRADEAPA